MIPPAGAAALVLLLTLVPVSGASESCPASGVCMVEDQHPLYPDCTYAESRAIATADGADVWAGGIRMACPSGSESTFVGAGACVPDSDTSTRCQSVGWMDTTTTSGARVCSISNLFVVPCPPVSTPELGWGHLLA